MAAMVLIGWSLLGLGVQDPSELDRLIRSLGAEGVEEREKAQDRLTAIGLSALPALKEAAREGVGERASRARAALAEIERLEADREVDRRERARRLGLRRGPEQLEKEKKPESKVVDGLRFDWFAVRREGHLALWTFTDDYLSEDPDLNEIRYEVIEAKDAAGKLLDIERCDVCSPRIVLLRETAGPVSVRIRGTHVWFSRRLLVFDPPKNGDRRRVSDFAFELAWPEIRATCARPWPASIWAKSGKTFEYDVREGVDRRQDDFIGAGGGGGGRFGIGRWCKCSTPKPWVDRPLPPGLGKATIQGDSDSQRLDLGDVKIIRYRFKKPVLETFEFTLEAAPRK